MMPYVKMGKILSESNVLCLAFLLAYDDGLKSRCVVVIVFVVVVVVCCSIMLAHHHIIII